MMDVWILPFLEWPMARPSLEFIEMMGILIFPTPSLCRGAWNPVAVSPTKISRKA